MILTRQRVAEYLADGLDSDRQRRVRQVAAWLVARRRESEVSHLTRDVASVLAERGYLTATLVTANPVSASFTHQITTYLKKITVARYVELEVRTDPAVVGGVMIELPDSQLDATVQASLHRFVSEMSQ